jgi:DNA ligase D-like protein (predicted 3'-phosphoesterase)
MPKKLKYSIQEHNATRLHWDLRLEYKGVLKSWAIPKKPDPKEKRLAVQTEDHNIKYYDFAGEITEGYGKGTVKIWDIGTHEPEKFTDKEIITKINGKKLKGTFCLIKFKPPKNWLFFEKK